MMISIFTSARPRVTLLLGVFLAVLGAIVVEVYVVRHGFSYRDVILVFGALVGGVIVFGGERGIQYGLVLWVLTLSLGYRTVAVTPDLKIHPAEIVLWLLLASLSWQRNLLSSGRLWLPLWLWLFIPFWMFGWWPLVFGEAPWDQMLNEFRDFLLFIPLLVVAGVVLQQRHYWRVLLRAFFVASTWIAVLGIVEYAFPGVSKMFPAFMSSPTPTLTYDGFARAQFSFWGGPMATFVCVLALPSAIILARWAAKWLHRAAIIAGAALQAAAIYIGGYRSVWLVLLIQVLTICLLRPRKHGAVVALVCLLVAVSGYQLLPKTSERASSGIAALAGRPIDSSAIDRQNRALGAWDKIIEYPLGSGWNSAGWVHSDFLQVAVNLGIIGGLIFLGGYSFTLLRLGRRVLPYLRAGEQGDLGLTLLVSFIGAGGVLAMEGVEVLPQLVLPVWFVWVLVEVWLRETPDLREFENAHATSYPYRLARVDYPVI